MEETMDRRTALKIMGASLATAFTILGCKQGSNNSIIPITATSELQQSSSGKMTYRKDKILSQDISLLAFGCMRFPVLHEGQPEINEEKALALIDYAYQHGVNYFDTAWGYHQGLSEPFVGKALKKYPRESLFIATKMPTWLIDNVDKAKEIFQAQLDKLQTDYIDFYHLHSLASLNQYLKVYENSGVYQYLMEEKKQGRIKRLGFSFHGHKNEFPKIADQHNWDFTMIQANYLDWSEDGEFLYNEAEKRSIQSMIMEPVRGGMLATLNPEAVEIFQKADPNRSVASWAMQYIGSKPNVLTVLSGMTTMEQVEDNVKTFSNFQNITPEQQTVIDKALLAFLAVKSLPCTECKYCMPCPIGIDIPKVFNVYNELISKDQVPNPKGAKDAEYRKKSREFKWLFNQKISTENHPNRCISCNHCISLCPQHIDIAGQMRTINEILKG